MKLVVGLGNPGKVYERTRHNLGFMIIDHMGRQNQVAVKRKIGNALVGEWADRGERILFAKPQGYMNRSGESVRALLQRYGATADDLVVVYDDLDLPFGRIRIRPKGGSGGHRGVGSIMEELAGASFCRVRVGIGRPPDGMDPVDYVLEPFNEEEMAALGDVITKAAQAVLSVLREGDRRAMELFNRPS